MMYQDGQHNPYVLFSKHMYLDCPVTSLSITAEKKRHSVQSSNIITISGSFKKLLNFKIIIYIFSCLYSSSTILNCFLEIVPEY